jgi:hypothetical protein
MDFGRIQWQLFRRKSLQFPCIFPCYREFARERFARDWILRHSFLFQVLERMLRMLLINPQIREDAAGSAQARVRDRYLWPQIAAEIEKLYSDLAGRNRIAEAVRAAENDSECAA